MRNMRNHFCYSSRNEEYEESNISFPGEWGSRISQNPRGWGSSSSSLAALDRHTYFLIEYFFFLFADYRGGWWRKSRWIEKRKSCQVWMARRSICKLYYTMDGISKFCPKKLWYFYLEVWKSEIWLNATQKVIF